MIALLIVLLIVAALLLMPVGIDAEYAERRAVVRAKVGPVGLPVLTFPKTEEEKAKQKKRPKKPKEKKKKWDRERIVVLIRLGLRALERLRRRLRVDELQLHLLVSTSDPYRTAMLYGSLNAAVYALLPALTQAVELRNQDIQIDVDFDRGQMEAYGRLLLRIYVGQLLVVGAAFGLGFLRWKLEKRREDSNMKTERTEEPWKTESAT